jgi:hypothetical protein
MNPFENETRWVRFWHEPIRAERLAAVRILVAFAMLADQFISYLPILGELFGPEGPAFAGLHDDWVLDQWYWTMAFFNTDDMRIVGALFGVWMGVTFLFLVGWRTRLMNVAVWFLTMCFINRNPVVGNSGDDLLCVSLFLLMLTPSGRALSLDRWLAKRRYVKRGLPLPADWDAPTVPPWGLRLLQIQLCVVYLTTGLAKLRGSIEWGDGLWPEKIAGTWWDGTSVYYVLNNIMRARVAWVEMPIPLWVTYAMTWSAVWWEVLFPVLVLWRRTRWLALWFGIFLHIGIWLMVEVGWFSFYTMALYGAWIPDSFWARRSRKNNDDQPPGA